MPHFSLRLPNSVVRWESLDDERLITYRTGSTIGRFFEFCVFASPVTDRTLDPF